MLSEEPMIAADALMMASDNPDTAILAVRCLQTVCKLFSTQNRASTVQMKCQPMAAYSILVSFLNGESPLSLERSSASPLHLQSPVRRWKSTHSFGLILSTGVRSNNADDRISFSTIEREKGDFFIRTAVGISADQSLIKPPDRSLQTGTPRAAPRALLATIRHSESH